MMSSFFSDFFPNLSSFHVHVISRSKHTTYKHSPLPARWVESQRSRNSVAEEESAAAAAKTATTTPRHGEVENRRGQQREPGKSQVSSQIHFIRLAIPIHLHIHTALCGWARLHMQHPIHFTVFHSRTQCLVLCCLLCVIWKRENRRMLMHSTSSHRIASLSLSHSTLYHVPMFDFLIALLLCSCFFATPHRRWRAIETCEMRERTSHSTLKHSSTVLQTLSASTSAREKREKQKRKKIAPRNWNWNSTHSAPISRELVSA